MVSQTQEKPVLFFSLEMPADDLAHRIISCDTGIVLDDIVVNNIDDGDRAKIKEYNKGMAEKYKAMKFYGPRFQRLNQIVREIKKFASWQKPRLIIIDYLQLITVPEIKDERLKVNEISKTIKNLTGDLEVPIIILSQFRRLPKDEWPELYHLKESGNIENDADCVIFMHNDEKKNERWVIVAKNRQGRTGKDRIYWHKGTYKFIDYVEGV